MRNVKCVLVLGGAEPPSLSWGWKNAAQCSLALLNKVNGEHQSWSVLFDITALSSVFAVQAVHYDSALFLLYATVGRANKVICMQGVPLSYRARFLTAKLHSEMHEKFKGCH